MSKPLLGSPMATRYLHRTDWDVCGHQAQKARNGSCSA